MDLQQSTSDDKLGTRPSSAIEEFRLLAPLVDFCFTQSVGLQQTNAPKLSFRKLLKHASPGLLQGLKRGYGSWLMFLIVQESRCCTQLPGWRSRIQIFDF